MKTFTQTALAICILVIQGSIANAQLSENFSDGDFLQNPTWTGNTADWQINTDNQLQSNNTMLNNSFYLTTPNSLATQAQWEFYIRLAFSTSGTNYVDVWLTASQSNLILPGTTGYFVRIGDTNDEISLYKKEANGSTTKIIDGLDGAIAASNNTVKIKVTRDANNQWNLYRDISGTGSNYFAEGRAKDVTFLTSSFFGILVKQSTASFFQKHYLDDIEIKTFTPDTMPPTVVLAVAANTNTLNLTFNEPVDLASAQNLNHYLVNNAIGQPISAILNPTTPTIVTLVFANHFANGVTNTLTLNGVQDLSGNVLTNEVITFSFYIPNQYDIVINEIMADPAPAVGLPEAEWIELKNTSPVVINLQGYKIGKVAGMSGQLPSLLVAPDSTVIVCTASQAGALSAFGRTASVTSFPSLGNDGDLLILQAADGRQMHAVQYTSAWYNNAVKANGGWSLEMIDSHNPCSGSSNWKASADNKGGTPGRKNSVDALNPDATAPKLLKAYAKDSITLVLLFDEPVDSTTASNVSAYIISDGIGKPISASPQAPLFDKITIAIGTSLAANKVYTVAANGLTDCSGNTIDDNTAKVGLSSKADSLDLIVNEILFDPKPLGADYLEIYNRSKKTIDLASVYITNRSSSTGVLGNPIPISTDNYLLFPGEFAVITTDPAIIQSNYFVKAPTALLAVAALPSWPNDNGSAILLNSAGQIIDELNYSYKWHFALVDDEEGVSLERIDYEKPTNDANNWTSAASSAGFGTPTYPNSQFRSNTVAQGEINISPQIFSPDNDGYEDFTFVEFRFPEPGNVANISIFDAAGRPVRILQRNTTTASTGSFRWDGLDDKQQKVPVGNYIIYTDIFNLKGQKKTFKNTVVVARKL